MFVMSCVMIVAFHPGLKLNRIIIKHSFGQSFKKLTAIDYLTKEQMGFVDVIVVKQLRDAAEHISQRKCKKAIAQMFSIKLYLIKHTLMSWFNRKIKSQHLEINKK